MEENLHIDDLIKNSLGLYSAQPQIGSFDKVMKRLEKKRKRRFFFILLYPGMLLLAGLFWLAGTKDLQVSHLKAVASPERVLAPGQNTVINSDPVAAPEIGSKIKTPAHETIKKHPGRSQKTKQKNFSLAQKRRQLNLTGAEQAPVSTASINSIENGDPGLSPEGVEFLHMKSCSLPSGSIPEIAVAGTSAGLISDQIPDKKIKPRPLFFIGAGFDPQALTLAFFKNPSSQVNENVAAEYLRNRKENNSASYGFAFGLNAGVLLGGKWEIAAGIGRQRIRYKEKAVHSPPVLFNSAQPSTQTSALTGLNNITYTYFSFGLSRLLPLSKVTQIKAGVGFQLDRYARGLAYSARNGLASSDAKDAGPLNKWLCLVDLKAGLIEDLGRNFQLQLNPHLFFSPNSMYAKNYMIKQKAVGAGLEALLLFKIR